MENHIISQKLLHLQVSIYLKDLTQQIKIKNKIKRPIELIVKFSLGDFYFD